MNRRCTSLPLPSALLCLASKYGISGDGRGCWDHAALVVRLARAEQLACHFSASAPRRCAIGRQMCHTSSRARTAA